MEEFIDDVKVVINALGYKVLEPLIQKEIIGKNDEGLLYISSRSANAVGKITPEGFVVLQGARLNEKLSAKSLSNGIVKLREKWMADEKVEDWVTTEDLLFPVLLQLPILCLDTASVVLRHGKMRMESL